MLNKEQVEQLLRPINPKRVLHAQNMSHVSQQDVRAHLIRVFGFEGWDKEILDLRCVRDEMVTVPGKNGGKDRTVPAVTYLCRLKLTVRDPQGNVIKVSEDVGTGTSPNLPDYGDAHDFAAKNAVSYALKRCATDLGDQFGLSLYNKGQTSALVGGLVVHPEPNDSAQDVQADVPQQVDLGDERPAEQVDTTTGEVTRPAPPPAAPRNGNGRAPGLSPEMLAVRTRVSTTGKALGWTVPQINEDFGSKNSGLTIPKATVAQLTEYAKRLEALQRVIALGDRLSWTPGETAEDYASEHGGEILESASVEQLTGYAEDLESRVTAGATS